MAYQFAHTQTYSRKGNNKNRSVAAIVAEAVREDDFCPHVESPKDPAILHGVSPDEIPQLIEQRIKQAKQLFPDQLKGKGKGIRKDQHIMEGAVFSHPILSDELENAETAEQYQRWRDDVIEWVKRDFDDRGLEFVSAVEHLDEAHPHIHAYGIPKATEANPRMDAKKCHAGHAARQKEDKKWLGNAAYKKAMRAWQDKHYAEVGERHGLLRFGPRRQRLDRTTWKIQQEAAQDLAKKIQVSEKMGDLTSDYESLKAEKNELEEEVKGLRAFFKQLNDTVTQKAKKAVADPIAFIKEQFVRPLEQERDELKTENSKLKSMLSFIKKHVTDDRSKVIIDNAKYEYKEEQRQQQPENTHISPSEAQRGDFKP